MSAPVASAAQHRGPTRPGGASGVLRTERVEVRGRPTSYVVGGRGLPVLFLHGWGMDHSVYRRPLRRLVRRGCRVLAPSLPGFGGTPSLPRRQRTLSGYAAWVDDFLAAVGHDESVLVLGHSFGGGVATRFAHDHPQRVRYLVLLNAVGDPSAFALSGRLPSDGWPLDLPRAVLSWRPSTAGLAMAQRVQTTLVANAVRDPCAMVEVGLLAVTADLRNEMAALAQRGLGVLVLWGDRDGVIPLSAFDAFCATFGTDGHVISGGHSWLLTEPDAFGEVLGNVIEVQREQHRQAASTSTTRQLRALLGRTTMPSSTVEALLDGVSPLWILSETAPVLAADLALCHPELAPGEIRAVARAAEGDHAYRLTVVAPDRPGLLADTAATVAAEGLVVASASVTTWPERGLALHAVTVHAPAAVSDATWEALGHQLRQGTPASATRVVPARGVRVSREGETAQGALVRVTAEDTPGLLWSIGRWFADRGVSIQAAHVETTDGSADDVFLIDGDCDLDALEQHLVLSPAAPGSSWAATVAAALWSCWTPCRARAG
jgi:pimeloyl-ACP methyl ester carboxylesterase/glycine cleavage system regulatory protein